MIVVFTGGDELEENEETLEDYLGPCPEPLKNILNLCRNRRVIAQNGGQPYTYEWFTELKTLRSSHQKEVESLKGKSNKEISELKEDMKRSYDDQLKRISDTVELRLRETTIRLEKQLAEEQAARLKVEANAQIADQKSKDEIRKLEKK
ncbi:hypothetical protein LWI28_019503 [Acer negundo]|uniref:AIG1-type G domain-containing protein n=1 Tax=Acer negundo TaxID=4023 RepID=A0AAD5JJX4_ACENE|nr:hypothetical protein LWI28_019503 [Acer negundo]